MDFIERIFHFAPDGGNGITEMGLILFCLSVFFVVSWMKRSGSRERDVGHPPLEACLNLTARHSSKRA